MLTQSSFLRNCARLLLRATSRFDASLGAGGSSGPFAFIDSFIAESARAGPPRHVREQLRP